MSSERQHRAQAIDLHLSCPCTENRIDSTWDELEASEAEAAPGKKQKKGRKGGKAGAAAQGRAAPQEAPPPETPPDGAPAFEAEADEEEQGGQRAGEEDEGVLLGLLQLQRGQQAPGQKGTAALHQQQAATAKAAAPAGPAERQEGYQRMLREYEDAQQAQQAQQAGSRASSRASVASVAAPSLAAAATADTSSSAGADSSTFAAGQDTQAVAPGAPDGDGDGEQQHSLAALQAASQAFDWSAIEGADADASWRQDAALPAAADWQEAPSQRPAADKARSGAAAITGSAGSKPGKAAAADEEGEQQAEQQRAEQQQRRQQQPQRPAVDPSKPRVLVGTAPGCASAAGGTAFQRPARRAARPSHAGGGWWCRADLSWHVSCLEAVSPAACRLPTAAGSLCLVWIEQPLCMQPQSTCPLALEQPLSADSLLPTHHMFLSPHRPSPGREHLKSGCPYGRRCRFSHPQFALEPPHPPAHALVANTKALPPPEEKQVGKHYGSAAALVATVCVASCPLPRSHFPPNATTACDLVRCNGPTAGHPLPLPAPPPTGHR